VTTTLLIWCYVWGAVEIMAQTYEVPARFSFGVRLWNAVMWPIAVPAAWVSAWLFPS
jgi:hypothetical protein